MENATTVEAVFSGGVFQPVGPVNLSENTRVIMRVSTVPPAVAEWMAQAAAHREEMFAKYGYCYDSTELVAADRRRDG
jgi:predicted DNA-binding antitoxin AbrB/MazE fold protein